MNLVIPQINSDVYKSQSQIARVITENWVLQNGYCPNCTMDYLTNFENNKPVADFYCNICNEEFELKSKVSTHIGNSVVNGAYKTMIQRISSNNNPNFFFLTYDKALSVNNFILIPKHFFSEDIIERRKPLNETAKRAGWIGCNIGIGKVPITGRIFLIKERTIVPKEEVRKQWEKGVFLREKKGESKGWILDVLNCLDLIKADKFSLSDVYRFEAHLSLKHPQNKHVKDKIRQQLQVFRDKNIIEFLGNGNYRKIK